MKNYIIAGCGVAGVSAATIIRKLDPNGNISIFSDEPYPFYTRVRLPQLIADEIKQEKLMIYKPDWYTQQGIRLCLNEPISQVDSQTRQVSTSKGSYPYDYLLLASGSHPFIPQIKGADKQGVFTLRSIEDALTVKEYARKANSAIVVGGGLLGLEAGNGLRKAGLAVSIVEFFPRLLPRQMDIPGAGMLKAQMEEMGFSFHLAAQTKEILGDERVEGVLLADGQKIAGNMVLISAGVRPNLKLAEGLGLQIGKGVVVDDCMQTSKDRIFAAGDLIEHRGIFYGIWPASQRQGEVAGSNMAGRNDTYEGTVPSNVLKVVGIDLVSVGEIDVDEKLESLVKRDVSQNIYRKLVIKDDILVGCILLGDVGGKKQILAAIENKQNISAHKTELLA